MPREATADEWTAIEALEILGFVALDPLDDDGLAVWVRPLIDPACWPALLAQLDPGDARTWPGYQQEPTPAVRPELG